MAYLVSQHFDLTRDFEQTQDHVRNLDGLLAAQTALAQDRGVEVARLESEMALGVEKVRVLGEALEELRPELAAVTGDLGEARQMVTDLTDARDVAVAVGERDVATAAASSAAELVAVRARIDFGVMDRFSRIGPVRRLVAVAARTLRSIRSLT